MKYQSALPFFHESDIQSIIEQFRDILLGNGMLTKGPIVKKFERAYSDYIGTQFGISTNSCTTALEIVLKSINIKEGDEVLVPAQTFVSTGSSVVNAGGNPVFCDTDDNFSIDFEDLKSKITKRTKAVIVVHYAGLIQENIFDLKDFLQKRKIFLIEDCAHASGANINGIMAGNIGDFGCHSFYSTKIMTTGEGGMITLNDENKYNKCASIRSIGIDFNSKTEIFSNIGSNYRMAEFQAILGLSQLSRLDQFVDHRITIANSYKKELKSLNEKGILTFQKFSSDIKHPFWKFIVYLNSDKISLIDLKQKLIDKGINISAPYFPLMHKQPVFKNNLILPNVENLSKRHFCLPIHFEISLDDSVIISSLLIEALK